MWKRHAVIGLVALVYTAVAPRDGAAQIALGPVELVLGTPKAMAIQALRRSYRVDSVDTAAPEDEWSVTSPGRPPFTFVGMVTFAAGRLSSVSREWAPSESGTPESQAAQVDAAQAVIGALLTLAPTASGCHVEDRSGSTPGTDVRAVAVVCGQRRIFIGLTRYQGAESLQVSEWFGASGR